MTVFILARRIVATVALLAVPIGAIEAGVGGARDGQVHHETVADAATHQDAQGSAGDHGHEHLSSETAPDHGPGHEHGTSVDHCTHVHAPVIFASPVSVMPSFSYGSVSFVTAVAEQPAHFPVLVEPPRA